MENKENNKLSVRFVSMNDSVQSPAFVNDENSNFIYYGLDNQLPYQLVGYYRNVGLHRAIIDKKKKMFLGAGIAIDMTDEKKTEKTIRFLENINPFETIDDLFDKITTDLFLFGGVNLQIIWEKNLQKIKNIYHMPYEQIRSGKKDSFNQVRKYYYNMSEDIDEQWDTNTDIKDKNIKAFPAFSTEIAKTRPQILHIHEYEPGFDYYPLPDYIGALKDINTLEGIADFHNANIHNNMQPGFIVISKGPLPTKEEQDEFVKKFNDKYRNTENAGKPIFLFNESEVDMTLELLESSDVADMYKLLSIETKENIVTSHQIPRAVASLSQPGSLGNTKEIIEGMELVRLNYIQPYQEWFLSKWNKLMDINGLEHIYLNAPSPNLLKYTLAELQTVLTQDEIREYLGKDPIGDEQKIDDIENDINNEDNIENNPENND